MRSHGHGATGGGIGHGAPCGGTGDAWTGPNKTGGACTGPGGTGTDGGTGHEGPSTRSEG